MVKASLIFSILFFHTLASSTEVTLSQKDVAEKILADSFKAKELDYETQLKKLTLIQTEARYDVSLRAEAGYELTKFENFSGTSNPQDEYYKANVLLAKPFSTGSLLGVEYSRTSVRSEFSSGYSGSLPAQQTQDIFGVTLEQDLWRNFLGTSDRSSISAAQKNYQAEILQRSERLQSLVLEGVRSFWRAYVAQASFQDALNTRDRYKKLVSTVKRKASYSYTSPGELAQVEAEYESREQAVKNESTNYLKALDDLTTLLNIPKNTDIKFMVPQEIPNLPKLPTKDLEGLRPIKSAKLRLDASKELESAGQSNSRPDISLVAKLYSSGLETSADAAYSELASFSKPKYYVGVKLEHNFGSGSRNEEYLNKKIARMLEETRLQRTLLELKDREDQIIRQVKASYSNAVSSKKLVSLREKAVKEINTAYNQGRTDISILIEAINRLSNAGVQYSRAIGDYQIALNEWAAFRDELILEQGDTNAK